MLPGSPRASAVRSLDAATRLTPLAAPLQGSQSLNVTLKSTALMSLAYDNQIVPPGTALQTAQVAARPQIYCTSGDTDSH